MKTTPPLAAKLGPPSIALILSLIAYGQTLFSATSVPAPHALTANFSQVASNPVNSDTEQLARLSSHDRSLISLKEVEFQLSDANATIGANQSDVFIDNLRVSAFISEPSTIALLIAFLTLAFMDLRRR
ncbi:MAG: hypothetical protein AAF546_06310 [Verrucomicrobiota bacterium]